SGAGGAVFRGLCCGFYPAGTLLAPNPPGVVRARDVMVNIPTEPFSLRLIMENLPAIDDYLYPTKRS
ncbi:hypothetical protein ACP1ZY_005331, partial [Escherichia coli]